MPRLRHTHLLEVEMFQVAQHQGLCGGYFHWVFFVLGLHYL